MPRYVIHIGPHKTATTYLQAAFLALHAELADRGIHYSLDWQIEGTPGHAGLLKRLGSLHDEGLEKQFASLNSSSWNTILISSEALVRLRHEAVHYLKSLVGTHPTEIVYYVRPWTEVVVSAWHGEIKRGGTSLLQQRLNAHLAAPARSHLINHQRILGPYAEAFGAANLRIASYSGVMREKIDILDHFGRSFLGIEDMPEVSRDRKNVSLGIVDSEILRSLNVIRKLRGGGKLAPIRAGHYMQLKNDTAFPITTAALQQDRVPSRLRLDAPELERFHRDVIAAYRDCLVPPLMEPDRLIAAKLGLPDHIHGDYIYAEGVLDELRAAYPRAAEIVDSGAVRRPRGISQAAN